MNTAEVAEERRKRRQSEKREKWKITSCGNCAVIILMFHRPLSSLRDTQWEQNRQRQRERERERERERDCWGC